MPVLTRLDIILVHGTWGRGFFRRRPIASWCSENSTFRNRLLRCLNDAMPSAQSSISVFNWSGANSILARAKAADELRAFLKGISSDGNSILIVAHSHGGNIAIRAVGKLDDPSQVYLCTLATPFFRLLDSGREYIMSEHIFRILSVGFLSFISNGFYSEFLSGLSWWTTLTFFILNLFVCVIGNWKLGTVLHALFVNPLPKNTQQLTAWQQRPQLLCESAAFNAEPLGKRLLVLRGVDDEAAMSLAMGAVANRILRLIYNSMVTPAVQFAFLAFAASSFVFISPVSPVVTYGQYFFWNCGFRFGSTIGH